MADAPDFVMWSSECPFGKDGGPVLGTMGKEVRHVVVMETEAFKRLLAEIPKERMDQLKFGIYS